MLYATEGILLCPICKEPVNDNLECDWCGMVVERKQIKHFSFNEHSGMCLHCKGRGYTLHITEEMIVQDYNRNLMQITKAGSGVFADQIRFVEQLPRFYNFDIEYEQTTMDEYESTVSVGGSTPINDYGIEVEFYKEEGRFSKAEEYYLRAINNFGEDNVAFYRSLANLYLMQDKTTVGMDFIKTALEKFPEDRGLIYYQKHFKTRDKWLKEETEKSKKKELIKWLENFDEGIETAKRENRPIIQAGGN